MSEMGAKKFFLNRMVSVFKSVTGLLPILMALLLPCCVGLTALAQSEGGQTDFSLFGGYLLPSQIQNVTDILPLFGARYAFNFTSVALELEAENAHAEGVFYAGPDAIWYIPNGDTTRLLDLGFHAGVAGVAQVKDSLWLRADLKFVGNPGASLYILAGLMFRPSGGL